MEARTRIIQLQIFVIILIINSYAYACTTFMAANGGNVLAGNNEDYHIPHTRIWFIPSNNAEYGRAYVGFDNFRPQGGMNDQGLFFDALLTETLKPYLSKNKPAFKGDLFDSFLAKCASVNEVLKLLDKCNLEFMSGYQLFFVDKTGESAIVEGDRIIRREGNYQAVTNFLQSQVKTQGIPCEWYKRGCTRYKKAQMMLKDTQTNSIEHFKKILKATHQNSIGVSTLYSNICDLTNGTIHLYYQHDFSKEVIINLEKELMKSAHYYEIPTLFNKSSTYGKKEYRNNSPAFKISYPNHFNVVNQKTDEIFRAKNSFGGVPILTVSLIDKPKDIPLSKIATDFYFNELNKHKNQPKLIYTADTILGNGRLANEALFDCVADNNWPIKLSILSTYWNDKLIFVTVQSWQFPQALKEFQYSLHLY